MKQYDPELELICAECGSELEHEVESLLRSGNDGWSAHKVYQCSECSGVWKKSLKAMSKYIRKLRGVRLSIPIP